MRRIDRMRRIERKPDVHTRQDEEGHRPSEYFLGWRKGGNVVNVAHQKRTTLDTANLAWRSLLILGKTLYIFFIPWSSNQYALQNRSMSEDPVVLKIQNFRKIRRAFFIWAIISRFRSIWTGFEMRWASCCCHGYVPQSGVILERISSSTSKLLFSNLIFLDEQLSTTVPICWIKIANVKNTRCENRPTMIISKTNNWNQLLESVRDKIAPTIALLVGQPEGKGILPGRTGCVSHTRVIFAMRCYAGGVLLWGLSHAR